MLQLKVNNMIEFNPAELPGFLMQKIRQDLTLSNPDYVRTKKLAFWTGGLKRKIYLYRYGENGLTLPKGLRS